MRSYRYHFALDSQIGSEMYTDLIDLIFDGYLEFGTVQYYLPNCICIFFSENNLSKPVSRGHTRHAEAGHFHDLPC